MCKSCKKKKKHKTTESARSSNRPKTSAKLVTWIRDQTLMSRPPNTTMEGGHTACSVGVARRRRTCSQVTLTLCGVAVRGGACASGGCSIGELGRGWGYRQDV